MKNPLVDKIQNLCKGATDLQSKWMFQFDLILSAIDFSDRACRGSLSQGDPGFVRS